MTVKPFVTTASVGIGTVNVTPSTTRLYISGGNLQIGEGSNNVGIRFSDGTYQTTASTSTPPGGTTGAVQYNTGSGFGGNATLFYYDSASAKVGIGTNDVTTGILNVVSAAGSPIIMLGNSATFGAQFGYNTASKYGYLTASPAGTQRITFNATGVGINGVTALNALDVSGGAVFGSGASYAGSATAPADGLLIQGSVGLGTTTSTISLAKLGIWGGNLRIGSTGFGIVFSDGSWQTQAFNTSTAVTSFSGGTTGLTPSSATTGAVTLAGTLVVANGGTGQTTLTTNGVLYGAGTGALQVTAQGGTNTVLTANGGAPSFSATPTVTSLTTTGSLTAGNQLIVSAGGASITGYTTITGNLAVTGNILLTGNTNTINSNVLVVNDPIIYIGDANPADLLDMGIVASYTSGTYRHTGFARDNSNNTWTLFDNLITEPSETINWAQTGLNNSSLKAGNVIVSASIPSTSTATGALTVSGGAGITGNLNVGGISLNTGNVGIGTGAVTGITAGNVLAVFGNALITGNIYHSTNAVLYNGTYSGATWNGTTIGVGYGGTGATTLTTNGLLYGNGTGAVQVTAQGGTNTILVANGGAPSFSATPTINTSVTVPTIFGGTSASSSLALQSTSGAGTSDSIVLKVGNNGAITAINIASSGNVNIDSGLIFADAGNNRVGIGITNPVANLHVVGTHINTGNVGIGTSALAGIIAGNVLAVFGNAQVTGNVYYSTNSILYNGTYSGATWNGTTIGVGYGGTGATTLTTNGVLYGNGTSAVQVTAQGGTNTILVASGGAPSFSASPTINTSVTVPAVYGGTAVNSNLTIQSTTGAGTGDNIFFKVGNNGATQAMMINTNGNVGIGTSTVSNKLSVYGGNIQLGSTGNGILFPDGTYQTTASTSTPPGGTTGAVQYNTGSGFGGNATLFYYDSANAKLGIGTNDVSTGILNVVSAAGSPIIMLGNSASFGSQFGYNTVSKYGYLTASPGGAQRITFNATGVGINGVTALNALDVSGGAVFGSGASYAGSATAPTDGLLIQGSVGLGTTTSTIALAKLGVWGGNIRIGSTSFGIVFSDGSWQTQAFNSSTAVTSFSGGTTGLTPSSATTGAVTLAGTLVVSNGGTGQTTLTTNGVLYGNGTGAVGTTAQGGTNTVLTANGGAPSFSSTPTVTSLTATSSVTAPSIFGGTTASSTLTLQSTSGAGTSDSIALKVGNNGAITAMTVNTNGNVGIATTSPVANLHVVGTIINTGNVGIGTATLTGINAGNVLAVFGSQQISGNFFSTSATASTGTSTGAIVTSGGIGAAGNLNIGGVTLSSGNVGVGTSTVTGINAGNVLAVFGSQQVSGTLFSTSTTASTTAATGAIVTYGGIGVAGNLNVTGNHLNAGNIGIGTSTVTGINAGNVLAVFGNQQLAGNLFITSTAASTSTSTGAIITSGGIGVAGNINVGTSITVPTIYGGSAASSTLTIQSTSGAGTTDSIVFKTGSSSTAMTINTSGNVGIGTTSPVAPFQWSPNSSAAGFRLNSYTISGSVYPSTSINTYNTGGYSEGYYISYGRGTPASPGIVSINDTMYGLVFAPYNGTDHSPSAVVIGKIDNTVSAGVTPTALVFATGNSVSNYFERMRISSSGTVGIGTNNPQVKMHVQGGDYWAASSDFVLASSGTVLAMGMGIPSTGNTYGKIDLATNGGTVYGKLALMTAGGQVGIGTISPGSTLQVNGNAAIGYSSSTSAPSNGLIVSGNVGIATTSPVANLHVVGTHINTGNVGIGTATLTGISTGNVFAVFGNGQITGNLTSTSTTASTSTSTGAIVTSGGIGVSGNINVGTSVTTPILYGGSAAGSTLTIQSTSGAGTSDSIAFKVGNNGATTAMTITTAGNVGINTTTPGYRLEVNGSFAATTKSFLIDHPTKSGKKLRYGSLEGPENGVYVRGRIDGSKIIELPDYWEGLVDLDTITIQLTPIGHSQNLHVVAIDRLKVYIDTDDHTLPYCYYHVFGERKDVEKLIVEF